MAFNQPQHFKFYDYESTGLDTGHDQVVQVAGISTDADLNLTGDDIIYDVRLRADVVPSPIAFAITGIPPARLAESNMTEFQLAGEFQQWLLKHKNTNITGFNTQRYDDEVTRFMNLRTLVEPYNHEWKNGNSRSDIMRLVQFIYALRPECMKFPAPAEGKTSPSLKLGDLCSANSISLVNAHDARADVLATIELARLIKQANPKLWNYFLQLADKHKAAEMVSARRPMAFVSPKISRDLASLSVILPVYLNAKDNKCVAFDLRYDPRELLDLPPEEIKRRLFSPTDQLADGERIKGALEFATNKAPMLVGTEIFRDRSDVLDRAALNLEQCMENAKFIDATPELSNKIVEAFVREYDEPLDVYSSLYSGGFLSREAEAARSSMRRLISIPSQAREVPAIVTCNPAEVAERDPSDRDRMYNLVLRAKWGNFTDLVQSAGRYTPEELKDWAAHMREVWLSPEPIKGRSSVTKFHEELAHVRATMDLSPETQQVLVELEALVKDRVEEVNDLLQAAGLLLEGEVQTAESVRTSSKHDRGASLEP